MRQSVLPLFLDRQHLHRDVPRGRIELQVVEHGPAEHVRQEDIERDRRRQVLPRQQQRRLAAIGDDALEALVARQTEQHARVVRIVLDDQQHAVALADVVAIVGTISSAFATARTGSVDRSDRVASRVAGCRRRVIARAGPV